MTVGKGEDWGEVGPLAPDAPVVDSDRALAAVIERAGPDGPVEVGLTGGDLARTLGVGGGEGRKVDWSGARTRLPIDAGVVTVDGAEHFFVANVVIRRPGWLGPVFVVANAAHLGYWLVAPRGHPNDGKLELLHARLSLSDKLKARRRLRSGSHLPHPDITLRSKPSGSIDVPRRARVLVDGHSVGTARAVSFEVVPDVAVVVI